MFHMRYLAAVLLLSLTLPAHANGDGATDVLSQYAAALSGFAGGETESRSFTEYYRHVLDGLDGRWVAASHLLLDDEEEAEQQPEADFLVAACGDELTSSILTVDLYGFEMITGDGTEQRLRSRYVARGGASFAVSTEPTEIVASLGLDDATDGSGALRSAIRRGNGSVAIFRPTPDVMVMVGGGGLSMAVYTRCP